MSFAGELSQERQNKIADHALEFVEYYEPKLRESAKKGYTGFDISLEERDDGHILRTPEFHENVELLLDGCKVKIRKEEYKNLLSGNSYYKDKLNISWN